MNQSLLFATSVAMLLEEVQTSTDPTSVRSSLLRVRRFSRSHGLTLELSHDQLLVDGVHVPRMRAGLQRLASAMAMNDIARITLSAGAVPRELLILTMLLGRARSSAEAETGIFEELRDAALWYVRVARNTRTASLVPQPESDADRTPETKASVNAQAKVMQQAAEMAVHASDVPGLARALAALASAETSVINEELGVLWRDAFTTAAGPDALRILVVSLASSPSALADSMTAFHRAGDIAAEMLIGELSTSESLDVRRACFDALIELRRGTSHLVALLEHAQWFVVRNAACLLGEFMARTAEPELAKALAHADERVRAAVVTALLRLDTQTARATVRSAIHDPAAEVRRRAVRGFLAESGEWMNVDTLLQALEQETELDVQLEFLYALGTLATPDAVQRLIRLCSIDGRHRPTEFRIAAAEALTTARLGAAVPMLRVMLKDPDTDARAAASHLIRSVS